MNHINSTNIHIMCSDIDKNCVNMLDLSFQYNDHENYNWTSWTQYWTTGPIYEFKGSNFGNPLLMPNFLIS